MMRKYLAPVVLLAALLVGWQQFTGNGPAATTATPATTQTAGRSVADAFAKHQSDVEVTGSGIVTRVLRDDTKGLRHQRFILRLPSGHSLLVVHNIDLAPRISSLHEGDKVSFRGEYVWNDKGGLVHWTHRDPDGEHAAGWLKHDGKIYH